MSETYTPGHTANATALMARRSLDTHAAFLKPLLLPGLHVLDIGCGPGSITLDIACVVEPGQVVGVDRDPGQVEEAQRAAAEVAVENVAFEAASVYELPYADGSFDLAFAHGLLEHLREPILALGEIRRVLRPGGRIALRSPDWGGFVTTPQSEDLDAALAAYRDLQIRNGGDVFVGRKLPSLLREAGFTDVVAAATYEIYPSAEMIGEYLAQQLEAANDDTSAATLRRWMHDPDALFAQAWFEAVGTR